MLGNLQSQPTPVSLRFWTLCWFLCSATVALHSALPHRGDGDHHRDHLDPRSQDWLQGELQVYHDYSPEVPSHFCLWERQPHPRDLGFVKVCLCSCSRALGEPDLATLGLFFFFFLFCKGGKSWAWNYSACCFVLFSSFPPGNSHFQNKNLGKLHLMCCSKWVSRSLQKTIWGDQLNSESLQNHIFIQSVSSQLVQSPVGEFLNRS